MRSLFSGWSLAVCVAAVSSGAVSGQEARAYAFRDYYVAIDSRADMTGYYVNHPNPNHNRLTLLFAHDYPSVFAPGFNFTVNHYHRVGFFNYAAAPTGWTTPLPVSGTPTVVTGNARLPEGSYTPVKLMPGTGAFAGKFVSADRPEDGEDISTEYDDFRFRSVQAMRADAEAAESPTQPGVLTNNVPSSWVPTSPVGTMFYSSRFPVPGQPGRVQARFTGEMTGAVVGLELMSATPGLSITDVSGTVLLSGPGSVAVMGDGNTLDFLPVFSIDASIAAPGLEHSATFRLVDLRENVSARLGSSGEFRVVMTAIPEPSALGLLVPAGTMLLRRRK